MLLELVVFTIRGHQLQILLGPQGLPSRSMGKELETTARRLLEEEVAADHLYLEQLYTFQFPRSARLAVSYLALVHNGRAVRPGRLWAAANSPPGIPADQRRIATYALARLRNKITYTNLAYAFLPDRFTLTDLQHTYEVVLGRSLDKRNFRKKILSLEILAPDGARRGRGGRPARLYQFTGPREVVFWPSVVRP